MSAQRVAVFATLVAKAGKRDELIRALQQSALPIVATEGGTEAYAIHTQSAKPNEVVFYEVYRDNEAVAAHQANVQQWFGNVQSLLEGKPAITLFDMAAGFANVPAPAPREIVIGERLPNATFNTIGDDGAPLTLTTEEVFGGKTVALLAVPGPFTPGCTQRHLPGYIKQVAAFKAKGVDTVACLAVSDAFVMEAWKKSYNTSADLLMLADNGSFTRAIGLQRDLGAIGLGTRSHRFSMLVKDGVVRALNVDYDGKVKKSAADELLSKL